MQIIDAHSHLWRMQDATVEGQRIYQLPNGRAMFFGEERQMLPPFIIDGHNSAEIFLSNMNYAQVGMAVVVQEVIDGNQDHYLAEVQEKHPDRFICCSLMDLDHQPLTINPTFRGVAIPGHRIHKCLTEQKVMEYFKQLEVQGKFLSMCLADDANQISQMREVIEECPTLKIAIGHFGMPTEEPEEPEEPEELEELEPEPPEPEEPESETPESLMLVELLKVKPVPLSCTSSKSEEESKEVATTTIAINIAITAIIIIII